MTPILRLLCHAYSLPPTARNLAMVRQRAVNTIVRSLQMFCGGTVLACGFYWIARLAFAL